MIKVQISYSGSNAKLIKISGHANSGDYGKDLVCAAVSGISGGMLNAVDKLFAQDVNLEVEDNLIIFDVIKTSDRLQLLLEAFKIQLQTIEIQYPNNIVIKED